MYKFRLSTSSLVLSLFLLPLTASATTAVTFLGSDPKLITPSAVPIADLAGGGVDAAANGYYADSRNGTVVFFSAQEYKTLLSG